MSHRDAHLNLVESSQRLFELDPGAEIEAGFAMGARSASLQASPMGESLYRRMGFETIFDYRLYLCPAPEASR